MATLDTKTKDPFAHLDDKNFDDDYNARFDAEDKIMDELHKVSDDLPSPLTPDGKYLQRDLTKSMTGGTCAIIFVG